MFTNLISANVNANFKKVKYGNCDKSTTPELNTITFRKMLIYF